MFRDADDELKRLEEELLAQVEEEFPEELYPEDELYPDLEVEEIQPYITSIRNTPSMTQTRPYRFVNSDHVDCDLEEFSQSVESPKKDGVLAFLIILAILLTVGIVGIVLYWVMHIMGR